MTLLAPIDELRALPPPLARAVLARMAAEHGPEAVAALRWQVEAHRRPAVYSQAGAYVSGQPLIGVDDLAPDGKPWRVLLITGENGTGKTQLATWLTIAAILDRTVFCPRLVAADKDDIRDTLVHGPSGILSWLPPWISREWHDRRLWVDGREVSCIPAAAPAGVVGSGSGWVLFDDYAKVEQALGSARAEKSLVDTFRALREAPGRLILPTTPDGVELVREIARSKEWTGLWTLDLGRIESNASNLAPAALDNARGLRDLDLWTRTGGGAFADVDFRRYRVDAVPRLRKIRVCIDPAKSSRSRSCEVGIVAVGLGEDDRIYGLADRSNVLSSDDWPTVAHQLLEELRADHPEVRDAAFVAENNAGGDAPAALLRAAEKIRHLQRGEPGVPVIQVIEVTARQNEGKGRRASEIVAVYKGNQGRMARGLGILEGQLAKLVDNGTGTDRADSFVWGARDLAGLGDAKAADAARMRGEHAAATRAQFAGLQEAQRRMPAPAFGGNRV